MSSKLPYQRTSSRAELARLGRKGFTLLEVLVATMITSMVLILVVNFMITTFVNNAVDTARADLLREAQLTLDTIGRDIRLSAIADQQNRWPDENAPDAPTDEYSWVSDVDTLVLATAAFDSSNTILFSDSLHYVTNKNNNVFFVSDGVLYKRVLADPVAENTADTTCPPDPPDSCPDDIAMVDTVLDFTVRYFDNQDNEVTPTEARSIELSLDLQKERFGRTIDATYSTRTVFRNE
jgi:prepilin-type N-terminal cleavage/methylation domain-containing protein